MGFTDAIRTCFRKYATFSGRASRPEFWWFALFCFLGSIAAGIVDTALFGTGSFQTHTGPGRYGFEAHDNGPLGALFALATFLPSLAAGWRRMHDTGRSGLYLLYPFIVMIGISMYVFLAGGFPYMGGGGPALTGLAGVILGLAVLVLILSPFLVLWWLTRPSQPFPNEYGPNPSEVSP